MASSARTRLARNATDGILVYMSRLCDAASRRHSQKTCGRSILKCSKASRRGGFLLLPRLGRCLVAECLRLPRVGHDSGDLIEIVAGGFQIQLLCEDRLLEA
jgi:hypothetical protein